MTGTEPTTVGRVPNPIVTAAAEQVAKSKRRRTTSKARELPRWECRDQLALFDPSTTSESDR
ncbi:hypothetical protein [Nocardia beijingensis]|uniref:hypothetical protein n=1 Tax=Nocardia beijingensis TaxID=95162 RepID=UPI000A07DBC7|nr:hypothetical protein [Nocardia beijingensis]